MGSALMGVAIGDSPSCLKDEWVVLFPELYLNFKYIEYSMCVQDYDYLQKMQKKK